MELQPLGTNNLGYTDKAKILPKDSTSNKNFSINNVLHKFFKDTGVIRKENQVEHIQTDEERERFKWKEEKAFQEYIRDVFVILAAVFGIATGFASGFCLSFVKDTLRYNKDYFIVFGVLLFFLPPCAFIVRGLTTEKYSNILRWIFMTLFGASFVLGMAGLACIDLTECLVLTLLGFITLTYLVVALFGFVNQYTYTKYKGLVLVVGLNLFLAVLTIPSVWYGAGSQYGKAVLSAYFVATLFCLFSIYDVIRLSDYDKNLFLNDLPKPKNRDYVWDSVHMFLEWFVLCLFVGTFALLILLALVFFSFLVPEDNNDGPRSQSMTGTSKTTISDM